MQYSSFSVIWYRPFVTVWFFFFFDLFIYDLLCLFFLLPAILSSHFTIPPLPYFCNDCPHPCHRHFLYLQSAKLCLIHGVAPNLGCKALTSSLRNTWLIDWPPRRRLWFLRVDITSRDLEASPMRSLMYLVNFCIPLPLRNEKTEKARDHHHPLMKNMYHSELFIVYKLYIQGCLFW